MQGQPFLGSVRAKPREYIFAHRDRMDETFDRIRAVRDVRYKYIRNFHPELPYAQVVSYAEEMPTMKEWRRLHAEGALRGPQKLFFAPRKPTEELYDTEQDPFEINNLAEKPEHRERLRQMRAALDQWIEKTGDLGAVPETELVSRGLVRDVSEDYKERGLDRMYPPGVRPASRK
jgi:arylsulfatase A-like enzyme